LGVRYVVMEREGVLHDRARPHTAKFTAEALAEKRIVVIPWAAFSPDWNPSENLWSILKRRMNTTCFDDKDRLEDGGDSDD
jgi:transposase